MCAYLNDRWTTKSPIRLAAYAMWRLNWIHPFTEGNGRTSRAVSYLVLCLRLRALLPGKFTIPEQIEQNCTQYYKALEAADEALAEGQTDLSAMKDLLASMLANSFTPFMSTPRAARRRGFVLCAKFNKSMKRDV